MVLSPQLLIPPHSRWQHYHWGPQGASVDLQPNPRTAVGYTLRHSRPNPTTFDGILCFHTVAHCSSQIRDLYVLSLHPYTAVLACYCTAMRHYTGDRRFVLCPNTLQCWHNSTNQNCIAQNAGMQQNVVFHADFLQHVQTGLYHFFMSAQWWWSLHRRVQQGCIVR